MSPESPESLEPVSPESPVSSLSEPVAASAAEAVRSLTTVRSPRATVVPSHLRSMTLMVPSLTRRASTSPAAVCKSTFSFETPMQ